jgi:hypothetical protein
VRDRRFTVEQASACLPTLVRLLDRIQRGAVGLRQAREAAGARCGVAVHEVAVEQLLAEPSVRRIVEDIDGAVEQIDALGAELKDVDLGLVDFPGERDGEAVYWCWQYGEDRVRYWHRRSEGFAGRRPLPGLPPPPPPQ